MYLPDQKPVLRVPRGFVLDVRRPKLTRWQILRTLAPEEFEAYVTRNIAMRQERIIDKHNQGVEMLPMFAEKLAQSHLVSRKPGPTPERSQERKSPQRPQAQRAQAQAEGGAGGGGGRRRPARQHQEILYGAGQEPAS